jgi:hypothetical protein
MKKLFELTAVLALMLGLLGVISADSGYGAVGAIFWIFGVVMVLIGYLVGVVDSPEYKTTHVYQYPPVPPGTTAFCPHCGAQVGPGAAMCPGCGRTLQQP